MIGQLPYLVNASEEFERPGMTFEQGRYSGFNPLFSGNQEATLKSADWNWLTLNFTPTQSALQAGGTINTGQTFANLKIFGLMLPDMTQGSILFAGVGGQVSQNNSSLFWDNTNLIFKLFGSQTTQTLQSRSMFNGDGTFSDTSTAGKAAKLGDGWVRIYGHNANETLDLDWYQFGCAIDFRNTRASGGACALEFHGYVGTAWQSCTTMQTNTNLNSFEVRIPSDTDGFQMFWDSTGPTLNTETFDGIYMGTAGNRFFKLSSTELLLGSGVSLGWYSASSVIGAGNFDLFLQRDAAWTLALKPFTNNAQTFRIYGNTTNYLSLKHNGSNGVIDTDSAVTVFIGGTATAVEPGVDAGVTLGGASNRWNGGYFTSLSVLGALGDANPVSFLGNAQLQFGVGGSTAVDIILQRDAAQIAAFKNGASQQTLRIYGATSGSHYLTLTNDGTNAIVDCANGRVRLAPSTAFSCSVGATFWSETDDGVDIGIAGVGGQRFRNGFFGGYVSAGVQCLTKTSSPYSVSVGEQGCEYDNNGATGQVIFNLPASAVGLVYTFMVVTAQNIRIAGNGADTIQVAGSTSTATTGHIDNATSGGVIRLSCHVTGKWVATAQEGTWTVT